MVNHIWRRTQRRQKEKRNKPGLQSQKESETFNQARMERNISLASLLIFLKIFNYYYYLFSPDYTFPTDIFIVGVWMTIIPMRRQRGESCVLFIIKGIFVFSESTRYPDGCSSRREISCLMGWLIGCFDYFYFYFGFHCVLKGYTWRDVIIFLLFIVIWTVKD